MAKVGYLFATKAARPFLRHSPFVSGLAFELCPKTEMIEASDIYFYANLIQDPISQ